MEKSKIPLTIWFKAIYLFVTAKRGISSCQMAKWLGVTQRTAWFMIQRLTEAVSAEGDIILNGIVEVDESSISPNFDKNTRIRKKRKEYYKMQREVHGLSPYRMKKKLGADWVPKRPGRKKGNTNEILKQNRIINAKVPKRIPFELKKVVFGMVERDGRVVFKKLGKSMRDINKRKIYPFMEKYISENATVVSDEHIVYKNVGELFKVHLSVNHNKGYVVDGIHTNNIENVWNHFKRVLSGTHFHLSFHHLDRYLNIHAFRWNRRKLGEKQMVDDLIEGLFDKRLMYKDLIYREDIKNVA